MQLRYGAYAHPPSEVTITTQKRNLYNEGGARYAIEETWQISGFLQAANQAAITQSIQQLQNAYSIDGQSIGFFDDSGAPTAHGILASQTLGGVKIVAGPQFERGESAEYTTYRYYGITAQWVIPILGVRLMAFQESLSFTGTGGPQRAFLPVLDGIPPRQILRQVTTVRCTQSGSAIGWLRPVQPPPPLFPQSEHVDRRRVDYQSPKRVGPVGRPEYTEFPVSWSYDFEDIILFGQPNRWVD
jgi:hypothetical protein